MTSALALCKLSLILKQSSVLIDTPVITWHAFSEFVPDLLGLWPALMLGKIFYQVTYSTTYNLRENELFKTQPSSFVSCLPLSKLRHKEEHTQTFSFQGIVEIHIKKPSCTTTNPKLQKPGCRWVRQAGPEEVWHSHWGHPPAQRHDHPNLNHSSETSA